MSPEEQARLLQDLKEQFIRSIADVLTLKSKVEGRARDAAAASKGAPCAPPFSANGGPTMGDYLLDVTRLSVSFYQSLLDLNSAYWEKVATKTGACAPGAAGAGSGARREKTVIKRKAVVAARDENITFDVEIENTSNTAGTFRFFASDFAPIKSTNPAEIVRPPLKINPPRPNIAPGAKERVKIIVPISNILMGGKRYKGRISVRGPSDAEIVLRIKVEDYVAPPG